MKQLKRQAEIDMAERLRSKNIKVDPDKVPTGAESVAKELDELNANHQRLLDLIYERLRRIAAANPGDIVTLVSFFFFSFLCPGCYTLCIFANAQVILVWKPGTCSKLCTLLAINCCFIRPVKTIARIRRLVCFSSLHMHTSIGVLTDFLKTLSAHFTGYYFIIYSIHSSP